MSKRKQSKEVAELVEEVVSEPTEQEEVIAQPEVKLTPEEIKELEEQMAALDNEIKEDSEALNSTGSKSSGKIGDRKDFQENGILKLSPFHKDSLNKDLLSKPIGDYTYAELTEVLLVAAGHSFITGRKGAAKKVKAELNEVKAEKEAIAATLNEVSSFVEENADKVAPELLAEFRKLMGLKE